MTTEEVVFWKEVYVAALRAQAGNLAKEQSFAYRAGELDGVARLTADNAVRELRRRMNP